MFIDLCTETAKPVFEGDKICRLWNALVCCVYLVVGNISGDSSVEMPVVQKPIGPKTATSAITRLIC